MNKFELDIVTPGSLNRFSSPDDEENYGRVRREIQQLANFDALLDAAYRNDEAKIDSLVAERLHPDRPRANGKLALHIATRLGYVGAVETLLKCEADITSKTWMGETALRIAAESHYPDVVKLLLEKGAPTDVFDNDFDFWRFAQAQRRLAAEPLDEAMPEGERIKAEEYRIRLLSVCDYLDNPPLAEGPSSAYYPV